MLAASMQIWRGGSELRDDRIRAILAMSFRVGFDMILSIGLRAISRVSRGLKTAVKSSSLQHVGFSVTKLDLVSSSSLDWLLDSFLLDIASLLMESGKLKALV